MPWWMSELLSIKYDIHSDQDCLANALNGEFTNQVKTISYRNTDSLAVVAYDNITPLCADIYLAGVGNWCTRTVLTHFINFAFDTLCIKRIVAYIAPENEKSIRFAERLGFVKECTLRGLGVHQYSLLKEDTKYYGIYSRFIQRR